MFSVAIIDWPFFRSSMVALKGVQVRIVSSSDGRDFVEYDNPKATTSSDDHSSEKFIEAITDRTYHIEVNVLPSFKLYTADGIKIGLRIDGTAVDKYRYHKRDEVEKKQKTGAPFIDSWVNFREGSTWRRTKYSFGPLKIGKTCERRERLPPKY